MTKLIIFFKELFQEVINVSGTLFKIMIPAIVAVKLLELLGATQLLSTLLAPLMQLVGLPDTMGLVWATTLVTNLYAGLLIFSSIATENSLSVAQVSVLGSLMLLSHGLPIEVVIAKKAGVKVWVSLLTRIGGALCFAYCLHLFYQQGNLLSEPAKLAWQAPLESSTGVISWLIEQAKSLAFVQLIIIVLLFSLKVLKAMGIEQIIALLLQPILALLGISREAISLTIVGITLGLSFGGGLLINEARQGKVKARDVFTAMVLLGILHSLIEDTLLILLMGADLNSILWARILFAIIVVAVISRVITFMSEASCQRYFYSSVQNHSK
jgi:hypothetical protein